MVEPGDRVGFARERDGELRDARDVPVRRLEAIGRRGRRVARAVRNGREDVVQGAEERAGVVARDAEREAVAREELARRARRRGRRVGARSSVFRKRSWPRPFTASSIADERRSAAPARRRRWTCALVMIPASSADARSAASCSRSACGEGSSTCATIAASSR